MFRLPLLVLAAVGAVTVARLVRDLGRAIGGAVAAGPQPWPDYDDIAPMRWLP